MRRRVGVVAVIITALVVLPNVARAAPHGGAPAPGGLELFVHPHGGGGWSAHTLEGVMAGVGAPSVAASRSGRVVLAERTPTGDVVIADGTLFGAFTTTDVSHVLSAPEAASRPVAAVSASGVVSVWYRTTADDLEVVTQAPSGAFSAADVTATTGAGTLLGDPTVSVVSGSPVGYAVTAPGAVTAFTPPATPGDPWTASDPTGGLSYPPLAGAVAVFDAPGLPAATVVLGVENTGDLIELTDEVGGRPPTVGTWSATDLTSIGTPAPLGPLQSDGGALPDVTYPTFGGDVAVLTLRSGLSGDVVNTDLTEESELSGAIGAVPTLVEAPGGAAVADRTMTGDLDLATIDAPTVVSDVSFQPHTQELIAGDVGAAEVGSTGPMVLVAEDGGPIATTPLERRIAMLATAFDQQHRGFQTLPAGSYCNPFTASFGRGWTSGCPRGWAAEEWCSDFAQFVWRAAGIDTAGITGWSATFATWGAKHHLIQWGTRFRARVGDAIVWGQRSPLYGQHVGIIVAVDGRYIDVVSGDSGGDFPRYGIGVWRWGAFVGSTSTVLGYKVLAVVQP